MQAVQLELGAPLRWDGGVAGALPRRGDRGLRGAERAMRPVRRARAARSGGAPVRAPARRGRHDAGARDRPAGARPARRRGRARHRRRPRADVARRARRPVAAADGRAAHAPVHRARAHRSVARPGPSAGSRRGPCDGGLAGALPRSGARRSGRERVLPARAGAARCTRWSSSISSCASRHWATVRTGRCPAAPRCATPAGASTRTASPIRCWRGRRARPAASCASPPHSARRSP